MAGSEHVLYLRAESGGRRVRCRSGLQRIAARGISRRWRGTAPDAQVVDVEVAQRVGGLIEEVVAVVVLVAPRAVAEDGVVQRLGDEAVAAPRDNVVVVVQAVVAARARAAADAAVADHDALQVDGRARVGLVVRDDGVGQRRDVDACVRLARDPELAAGQRGEGGEPRQQRLQVVLRRRRVAVPAARGLVAVAEAHARRRLHVQRVGHVRPCGAQARRRAGAVGGRRRRTARGRRRRPRAQPAQRTGERVKRQRRRRRKLLNVVQARLGKGALHGRAAGACGRAWRDGVS